jgi:AraC family transcriptional regulator, transcriptional activator of pobA
MLEFNSQERLSNPIPIYTLSDISLRTDAAGFELQRLNAPVATIRTCATPHRHDHYELWWITAGRGSVTVDTRTYTIAPPMLYLTSPGQIHSTGFSSTLNGYNIRFTDTFLLSDAHERTRLAELPLFYSDDAAPLIPADWWQATAIDKLLGKIEQEYEADLVDRTTVLRAYLHILLIEAKRLRQHVTPPHNSAASYLLTRRFLLLVEAEYHTGASVADYATQLHVTSAHLNQTIKRALNKTPHAIIQERVLLEAQRLLRYSMLSVAEIAQQLRFRDPSYFGRFFKKHTGRSPQTFRQDP